MQDENTDSSNLEVTQPLVTEPQPNPTPTQPAVANTAAPTATTTPEELGPSEPLDTEQQSASPELEKPKKREGGVLSFVVTLLVAFLLVQVINSFLFQSYKVFGSSMYSTLHDGDRLIISKVSRTKSKVAGKHFTPKRGQVIVFVDPQNPNIQLIKRVIGLPGERVVVADGKITVYNKEHPDGFNPDDAPYGKDLPATSGEKDVLVPANHLFVSGDNRAGSNSLDSRNELGTVPEDDIVGVLKVRIFPLNTSRFF